MIGNYLIKTMDEIKLTKEEQNIIDSAKEVSLSMSEKNDINK